MRYLAVLTLAVCASLVSGASLYADATTQPAADRPNVIVICTDTLSAGMTGFDGNPVIKTPNLDKLATQSARFSRAYTATPHSAGSQASILTGQYPHVHGVMNDSATISDRSVSFAEVFTRAGYDCALVGAWKLQPVDTPTLPPGTTGANPPTTPGATPVVSPPAGLSHAAPGAPNRATSNPAFSAHLPESPPHVPGGSPVMHMPGTTIRPMSTQPASMPSLATGPHNTPNRPGTSPPSSGPSIPMSAPSTPPPLPKLAKPGLGFNAYFATSDPTSPLQNAKVCTNGDQTSTPDYLPDWHTDRAIEFVRKSAGKPFCLCLFYPPVREPLNYPPGTENLYPPASLPPSQQPKSAKNLPGRLSSCEPAQSYRSKQSGDQLRQAQSKYYAMVTRMDENVGRLLRVLTELNLDRNTIVVFTSAQGFATGENGMWGTGPLFWDTFIRCPLLVRLPQSANAERTPIEQLVSSVDLAPTLLEAAGLPVPSFMQGRSLLTLARNGVDPVRPNECFAESDVINGQPFPARVLIADAYKLVDYLQEPDAADQFYNLKRDPGEEQNLMTDPVYRPLVKVMRARLDHWRKRTSDPAMR